MKELVVPLSDIVAVIFLTRRDGPLCNAGVEFQKLRMNI